jgi:hypothetical protein
MDRFNIIPIKYSEKVERHITDGDTELIAFCHEFRKLTKTSNINCIFSYRSLEAITKLKKELPLKVILKLCLVKGMDTDDLNLLQEGLSKVLSSNNEYLKAFRELR